MFCPEAAAKRLPVNRHSADYIFWSFEIIGSILRKFKSRVPLKPVQEGAAGGGVVLQHFITAHEQTQ